ncbi:MAG: c-type cytochrome [Bdellovibrionales bacterium]|nr:c-type cytochrome [Bdellovibrionales bacterium]
MSNVDTSGQSGTNPNDPYNKGGFLAFVFSMVFSLLFFVYIVAIHPGIDLKEVPEEGVVPQELAKENAGPVDISGIEKPWVPDEKIVAHGAAIFKQNCAVCHGDGGMGDGPAGKGLVPPPRNLVKGEWKKGGKSMDLYHTVSEGLPGTSMAAFGHLPAVDRWSLVQFIRSITENKPEDNMEELESFAQKAN